MTDTTSGDRPWQEPSKPIVRGAFIVFEGMDRTGKSTQVKSLSDELYASGRNIKTIRFPERASPIGQMIDNYLQSKTDMDDHAIHLLFSANRWEFAKYISENLAKGYTIICDRYYYSGVVYSAAKQNPSLTFSWALQPEIGLPRPDLVVFLDLEMEEARKRGGFGDEKYEKRELQERVRSFYLCLSNEAASPSRTDETEDMIILNAGGTIQEVGKKIWDTVADRLSVVEEGGYGQDVRKVRPWPEEKLKSYVTAVANLHGNNANN